MTETTEKMLLITSSWKQQRTFKMMPLTKDCPYNECIFDPQAKMLAIVGKEHKDNFHMLPKMNEHGEIMMIKNNKRADGKPYAEQRVTLDTYYEYFIEDKAEILDFIRLFGANLSFPYEPLIEEAFIETKVPEILD